LAVLLAAALAVCGCSSVAPPKTPAPTTPEQRTALAATLAIERQWLDSWFRGTPVRIVQRDDGVLAVDVPSEFCFDRGSSRVKPALAAVLDKVAESLRRRPQARLALLAAPDDRAGATTLALQRATRVQEHLRDRGVPAARLGPPTTTSAAAVQLRIGDGAVRP
jgi:outer membrane protein OmpA-like peptidoglycan-associated protein